MSKFENIFNINSDGTLSINKQELRGHKAFAGYIGNTKECIKDLMSIYLLGDPRSMYAQVTGNLKYDKIALHVGREKGWKPSAKLLKAVEAYVELVNISPTGNSFLAANKALYEAGNDINDIVESNNYLKGLLKDKVRELQSDTLGEMESISAVKECKAISKELLSNQADANKIIKDLPLLIKTVGDLASAWANEGNGTKELYGGGKLGNRE